MATFRPIVVSDGVQTQLSSSDSLSVGAGIDSTAAGELVIGGTNATSITIGTASITTEFPGPVELAGDVTTVGGTTFTTDATFQGDVTFGDASTDTVSFTAKVDSNIVFTGDGVNAPAYSIQNLADPVNNQDAATKAYVDAAVDGGVAGSNTQIQYNDNDSFGASSSFTWTESTTTLGVTGSISQSTGSVSFTANAASSLTTSAGALTLTSAEAATWSTTAGNLSLSAGAGISLAAAASSAVVVNESGVDADFRVEGDADQNLIFADASADKVGIGSSSPNEKLTINGVLALAEGSAPSATAGFGKLYANSAVDARPYFMDDTGQSYNLTLDRYNTLTAGSTVTVDLDPSKPVYNTVTLNQNTTFALSGLGNGRGASIRVVGDSTTRNLSFPGTWTWLGAAVPPTSLASDSVGWLSVVAFGATDADVVASWSYEGAATSVTGSGADNQIAVWSGTYTQDGSGSLTFNGTTFGLTGAMSQSGGAVTLSANAASSFSTSAGDLDLSAFANLDLDGASVDIDATGAVSIGAAAASDFTVAGANLSLSTTTSGSVVVTSAGLMDLNAGANLDVDVTGSMDFLSTGVFSIDGTGNSNMSATSGNLVVSTITSGTLELTGVALVDLNAGADLDVDVTGSMDFLSTGAFSIDGTGASNVSATSGNLTVSTLTSGTLALASAGLIDMDAAANLDVDVTGTVDILASSSFSIDGTGASNMSATSGDLTVSTITSGALILSSAGLMDMDAAANLDVDVTGTMDFLSSGVFSIDGTGASNVSATAGNLTVSTITSGNLVLSSAGDVDVDGAAITLDATAGISLDAAAASNFSVAGAGLTLATTTSGTLALSSAGLMDVDAGANLDIDVTGTMDMLSSGAFSIDGSGASNVSATSGNLTVSTLTSGNLVLSSAGDVDVDGAAVTVDATAGVSIDAAAASNFSVAGAGLTLATTTSGTLAVSGAALVDIDAGGNLDVDAIGTMDFLSGGAFSIDGSGASNMSATSGNLTVSTITSGDLLLSSAADVEIAAAAGSEVVVNEAGADANFRVEGDTDANLLFVDAGTDFVGIGTSSPTAKFSVAEKFKVNADGYITGYDSAAILDGEILIGDTADGRFEKATLTSGTGMSITNGAGSISLAATGELPFVTTGLTAGDVCYASSNNTGSAAVATAAATARVLGFVSVVGSSGKIQSTGIYSGANFITVTGLAAGQPAYLSKTSGKLTNNVSAFSTGDVVAEIGIVVNVASASGGAAAADILIQPKSIVVL